MFKGKLSLKRSLFGFMAAAVVMTGAQMTVLADNVQDEIDFHAGATAVINNAYDDADEGDADVEEDSEDLLNLQAGAAADMASADGSSSEEKDTVDLQAGAAAYLENNEAETIEADSAKEETEDVSNIVMANVTDAVNVRVEPSEDADTAGKLYKDCGGIILERRDGWTLLESGELTGWAKDEFLLFGEEAEALREQVGTFKATVQTEGLRVRKEPGQDAEIYTLLELGESVNAVADESEGLDGWVAVQVDDDFAGYVSADYVEVAFAVETGKTDGQIAKEQEEEEKKKLSENRGAVSVETSDVTLLAALIQCEAGMESYEGKLAVGAVVMNRVRSGSYPNSLSEVIYAPSQFTPAGNGKVAQVIASGPSASCIEAAQAAINGSSNVGGALHFRASSSGATGIVIGNQVFW